MSKRAVAPLCAAGSPAVENGGKLWRQVWGKIFLRAMCMTGEARAIREKAEIMKGMRVEADIYLLDIRAFLEHEERGRLMEEASSKLDEERREKARRIGREKGRAGSLGAGLLLQLAVRNAERRAEDPALREEAARVEYPVLREEAARAEDPVLRGSPVLSAGGALRCLTVPGLLKELDVPLTLDYQYGENGKPYLKNYPYFFNLSHSGDYVVCALSGREVGIDIQIRRAAGMERLAERYFAHAEADAFRKAQDREEFFFRLWARKEAYGKLTGKGIGDALQTDLWSGGTEIAGRLCWEEYNEPRGYSMAVCQSAGAW